MTLTSGAFTLAPGTRYLVFASRKSISGDSGSISTSAFTTNPTATAIGSEQSYDASAAHNSAWYLTGGAGTGTIKVTFAKATKQAYLDVIAIVGASAATLSPRPTKDSRSAAAGLRAPPRAQPPPLRS
jgi:hypothetical protein